MRGLHTPSSNGYFSFSPHPYMTPLTHPHLAMQTPHELCTSELIAFYYECSPWCEEETSQLMLKELSRRGVTVAPR